MKTNKNIIDLRSDTVTKPSKEMLEAMMTAEVGDDVYSEDPTVNELQDYAAKLLGKEAALFVPSGTMGNQIALNILTERGDEVIIDSQAHIYYYETAAPSILSGIQLRTLYSTKGEINTKELEEAIRPDIYYFPKTKVIALENTHNRHGGKVLSSEYILKVRDIADKYSIYTHLDGARLWNACIATNKNPKEIAQYFDTLSVCLSKGLGAPIGSLILGNKHLIEKALKFRKILGGGMRQAGYLAAAGLYAIKNNFQKLELDHKRAKYFGEELQSYAQVDEIETNIIMIHTTQNAYNLSEVCKEAGLLFHPIAENKIRVVFHLDIDDEATERALEIIKSKIV